MTAKLNVVTLLWEPNHNSFPFSRCYDVTWVEKLHRGFRRHLTVPFDFVCYVDRPRQFDDDRIIQMRLQEPEPNYSACIEPFGLGEPMILVGLDTVVLRNIDHLAAYCQTATTMALPRDPFKWERACTGVVLAPGGMQDVFIQHRGENDMDWLRAQPHVFIDDIFPGSVKSYKGHVLGVTFGKAEGLDGLDIVYFHGHPKMHQLESQPWIKENWF